MRCAPGWTRSTPAEAPCPASAVRVDARDELAEHALGVLVRDLARAGRVVPAAAVLEHQRADVRARGAVDDRLARREHGVLLLEAPHHMDRDVLLAEDG